jgi:predicted nucleic acid-binding Zn ribbon protein
LFGEEQAKHAKPLFLKNRTLTITCSTSSIAQEIRLNQQTLVDKINDKLGKKEVDRIRYLA